MEVARRAGVSQITVSRVMRGQSNVREDTRERVLAVARELGYQPNPIAQAFRVGKSNTVALLVGDIAQGWYSALAKEIQLSIESIGLDLLLYDIEHSPVRLERIIDRCIAQSVQAVVLATTDMIDPLLLRKLHAKCVAKSIAVFSVGRRLEAEGIPTISHDDFGASRQAVDHLIGRGKKSIAYLGRVRNSAVGIDRYGGYAAALKDAGIEVIPTLVWDAPGYRFEGGYGTMTAALDRGNMADAVICGSDELALGAMSAVLDRGLTVPDDVAFVGFGDLPWASYVHPKLTTVSGHPSALAQELLHQIQTEPKPVLLLNRTLLVRSST